MIEPFFPQLCTTLDAQLQTVGHSLAPADEQKLDTARIQKAIDKCGKGRAVMLHVNETNNAFLSGPLELKPDVTLIVGSGCHAVRLARSRALCRLAGQLRHREPCDRGHAAASR